MEVGELRRTTLATVPHDKGFHFSDGVVATDVYTLADEIEKMPDKEFKKHMKGKKNDFADWAEHVLHNPGLASDLRFPVNEQDQEHCAKTLRDHADWLKSTN